MTPIQLIEFGEPFQPEDRAELFYQHRGKPLFVAFMQYLRDEAYSSLDNSVKTALKGDENQSRMALGGFDAISQVIVKIQGLSEIPPKPPI